MKKNFRMILALCLALSMLFCIGCQPEEEAPTMVEAEAEDSVVTEELDLSLPAATIGDSRVITLTEFKSYFDMYASYYFDYGYDVGIDDDTLHAFQDMIMETLIQMEVIYHKVEEEGYLNFDAERQAEVDAAIAEEVDSLRAYYQDLAAAAQEEDPSIDIEQFINEGVADEAEYYTGFPMTFDEYVEWITNEIIYAKASDYMMNDMLSDVSITEEDVQAYYDDLRLSNQIDYLTDPESYKDEQEFYEVNGGDPVVGVPEGFSRILHIYALPAGEIADTYPDYNDKLERMDEIQALYGELSFSQGLNNATGESSAPVEAEGVDVEPVSLESLMEEYTALQAEIKAMEEEFYSAPQERINAAYEKLQAGEDFVSVMMEYGEDSSFTTYPIFREKGMLINGSLTESDFWTETIISEFNKLKEEKGVGNYCEPFQDEDGYHILFYVGDEVAGDRSLEELYDELYTIVLENAKSNEWFNLVDSWMNDEDTVVRYEENYRQIRA